MLLFSRSEAENCGFRQPQSDIYTQRKDIFGRVSLTSCFLCARAQVDVYSQVRVLTKNSPVVSWSALQTTYKVSHVAPVDLPASGCEESDTT